MADDEGPVVTFEIDGAEYPIPVLATFDMDEAQVLWDNCQIGLEDLVPDQDGEWSDDRRREVVVIMTNPAFLRTMLHVAYRREHHDMPRHLIDDKVGKVSMVLALRRWSSLLDEDDASPPPQESTTTPDEASRNASDDSSMSSGNGSTTTSEAEQDGRPAPTGATR
jgi:hypothetical protein